MPAPNFMIEDLFGALRAIAIFPLFVVAPGYAVAWILNIFEFRRRTLAFRLAFSLPLSFSICPILTYLLGHYLSMNAVWAFYGAAAMVCVFLLARSRPRLRVPSRNAVGILAVLVVWLAVSVFSLIDIQIGERLYYPASAIDYALRAAFVHSIGTTGIPPQNPFFQPGHPVVLRYHYFWLMMCSLADQAGGALISARQALIGGTFWAGAGLIALLAIYLRLFVTASGRPLNRRLLMGIALLAITGLDVIPALFFLFLYARHLVTFVLPSVELWNEHVDWFLSTTVSTPHAIVATVACFTGFLLLWHAGGTRRNVALAALAFASAAGTSVYVAFSFALFLAIWSVIGLAKKWYRETAAVCIAGAASVLLLFPYLHDLAGPGAGTGAGSLFRFTIREFSLAALVSTGSLSYTWRRILVNGSLLPLNYLLEFGLFFLIARYKWRQHRASGLPLSRADLAMLVMAVTSTLLCTFLKSAPIGNNDLGWRGFLMAQFVLLLWAVDLFGERASLSFLTAPHKQLLAVFFALGFAGTVTDLALIRFYPLLADRGVVPPLDWMSPDRDFGRRNYAERAAYEWLHTATPSTAAVQANPNVAFQDTAGMIYGDRRTVAGDLNCLTGFGGDPAECAPLVSRLRLIFPVDSTSPTRSLEDACLSLPVDTFLAKDTDPVWNNPQSWVWNQRPAYANAYVRLFRCQSRGPTLTRSR